jgi:phosphoribosylglycinamide formyltransferase 1
MRLLLVTERSTWGHVANELAASTGFHVTHFAWSHGEPKPASGLGGWRGDWIVGFKADYILSGAELQLADAGAINFHPAPPDLRGVGTYDVAVAAGRATYGVTCHHMTTTVDAGPIVAVRRFDVHPGWSIAELREAAASHTFLLYLSIMHLIRTGVPLPTSAERWDGPLHTWRDLERLRETGSRPTT